MKQILKNFTHEAILIISYVLMIGLLIWFNSQSAANSNESGLVYSMVLFGIVLVMYIFTFVFYLNTNRITNALAKISKKIKNEHQEGKPYLWDTYKNEDNLFGVKALDERYARFCREQKRLEASGEKSKSYGDVEDFINYDFIDDVIHKNVLSIFPGTMTGLGILFTFFGLSICLQSFHTGTAEEIMSGIDPLMGGLRVAFHTSIYGLIFSLVYNFSYRKKIEESYETVDEFIDLYREYVKPENSLDAMGVLLEYQDKQSQALEIMSTQLLSGMAGAFSEAMDPQFAKLNETISSFANIASKAQTEGMKKMVEAFLKEMNKAVGDNFREVRESMAETCRVQGEYSVAMGKALEEISGSIQSVCTVSADMQTTVQQLDAYVTSMQALQEKLQEGFDKYTSQIADNNELTKNQQQYLVEMSEAQKVISETLTALVSDTESCLTKLQQESGRFVETAEQATTTIIQRSEEWTGKMEERLATTEQIMQQAEQDISNSAISSLNTITQNVENFGQILSNQAVEQAQGIAGLKDQISGDMAASASRLEAAVSNISVHVEDALTSGFSEYSKEINDTITGLNETIRGIRLSTANLPQITNDATKGLQSAVDMTEQRIGTVLNALDQIMQKTATRQEALSKDNETYIQARAEIEASVADIKAEREQLQKLVNIIQKAAENRTSQSPSAKNSEDRVVPNQNVSEQRETSIQTDKKESSVSTDGDAPGQNAKGSNTEGEGVPEGNPFSLDGLDGLDFSNN